jgi:S-adenosylhomocysteine hydrolase
MHRYIRDTTLASMGVRIDTLTPEQREYLDSWNIGT